MIWALIQTIGRQSVTLVVFLLLAAILSPEDFGVLAMVMTWIGVMQAFSEMGFGSAIIQRKDIDDGHLSTTFYINVVSGGIFSLLGVALAGPCAYFFKTPKVQPIMAVASFGFLINSFSLTQLALATRELRFKDIAYRDMSAGIVGGAVGIIAALMGMGVWSLILQYLTTSLAGTLLLWRISSWRPSWGKVSFDKIGEIWPYSSKIFAFNLLKYFTQNLDKIIIGHFLGSIPLGIYTFAYRVTITPISLLAGAVGNYMFPKFSRQQDKIGNIKSYYLFVSKFGNTAFAPLVVVGAMIAPLLVSLFWGDKWAPAVPVIRVLAIFAILIPLISYVGQLMKALNRIKWLIYWTIFVTALIAVFILLGARWGIVWASAGLSMAYVVSLPVNFLILNRLIRVDISDLLSSVSPSFPLAVLCGGILYLFSLTKAWNVVWGLLFSTFILGGYAVGVYRADAEFVTKSWTLVRDKLKALRG